ncbi:MAG: restriction endonuclease subunit S [Muribaculaceae bacterium]|nr:restriction endonuclease subunit S [Muribaculaceae bacterium]
MELKKYKLGSLISLLKNGAVIQQKKGAKGIPITRIETLSNNEFNRDRLGYADITEISDFEDFILDDGDILISHINSREFLGRAVQYKKREGEFIIHGMNLLRLKTIPHLLNCTYAYYFFQTSLWKKSIQSIRKDAINQSSIAISDIKNLIFDFPSLDTQNKIANALSLIDRKIALNREINRNLPLEA